jgi:hypothetical protein
MDASGRKATAWGGLFLITASIATVLWGWTGLTVLGGGARCTCCYLDYFLITQDERGSLVVLSEDSGKQAEDAWNDDRVLGRFYFAPRRQSYRLPFEFARTREPVWRGSLTTIDEAPTPEAIATCIREFAATDTSGLSVGWSMVRASDISVNDGSFQVVVGPRTVVWDALGGVGSATFWLLPIAAVISKRRATKWRLLSSGNDPATCPRCLYDMQGVRGPRCPECGSMHPARAG